MTDNPTYQQIDAYIDEHLETFIDRLAGLVNQPSISARNEGIATCAEMVADMLRRDGFTAEVMPSDGYPVVYGEGNGRADKRLMFYLHYDVQPPEPLHLWESPPFEMTRRDGKLYGRGVSDDKAHIIARLAALEAIRAVTGELPCEVKFVIEGEEEIGSKSMPAFVEAHQQKLAAEACVWEFGGVNDQGRPVQYLGLRGMCYVELTVKTAGRDAHSGMAGSMFANAAWRLVWALNTLKDADENILIDGFYDRVQPPTAQDVDLLAQTPPQMDDIRARYELDGFLKGITDETELKVRSLFEPTCTICGLTAGYQQPGSKTVQPAEASAKLDFRLVPDQTPDEVMRLLRAHLDRHGFTDVEINFLGGGKPARVDVNDPFVQMTLRTAEQVYGREPVVYPLNGGSGPNHPFIETLRMPVVTAGVGYPDGRAHAPNENLRVADLALGIKHTARIIMEFAEM